MSGSSSEAISKFNPPVRLSLFFSSFSFLTGLSLVSGILGAAPFCPFFRVLHLNYIFAPFWTLFRIN